MGVISCTDDHGQPFAVAIFPKSGSTTLRVALAPWADPGQYTLARSGKTVSKAPGWTLARRFYGAPRAVAVLRNPWARIASRWLEKGARGVVAPFPEYCVGGAGFTPQAALLYVRPPLITWEHHDVFKELRERFGIRPEPVRLRTTGRDWRAPYRRHPEAVALVREAQDPDFQLGIEWEVPT